MSIVSSSKAVDIFSCEKKMKPQPFQKAPDAIVWDAKFCIGIQGHRFMEEEHI